MHPSLTIIEEAYSLTLNPDEDYFAQLQVLAASGELANKITANQVLFKLCMLVDAQAKEIKHLKDDYSITKEKLIELEGHGTSTNNTKLDPTNPL